MEINETLLRALSEVNGIAGNEGAVRQLFKEETAPYAQSTSKMVLVAYLRSILEMPAVRGL